jgi:hypothetical protein
MRGTARLPKGGKSDAPGAAVPAKHLLNAARAQAPAREDEVIAGSRRLAAFAVVRHLGRAPGVRHRRHAKGPAIARKVAHSPFASGVVHRERRAFARYLAREGDRTHPALRAVVADEVASTSPVGGGPVGALQCLRRRRAGVAQGRLYVGTDFHPVVASGRCRDIVCANASVRIGVGETREPGVHPAIDHDVAIRADPSSRVRGSRRRRRATRDEQPQDGNHAGSPSGQAHASIVAPDDAESSARQTRAGLGSLGAPPAIFRGSCGFAHPARGDDYGRPVLLNGSRSNIRAVQGTR